MPDTQHEAAIEAAARFLYDGSTDAIKRAKAGNAVAFDELNIVVRKAWITKAEGSRAAYDAARSGERGAEKVLADVKAECAMWRAGDGEPSEVLDEIAKLVGCPEREQ